MWWVVSIELTRGRSCVVSAIWFASLNLFPPIPLSCCCTFQTYETLRHLHHRTGTSHCPAAPSVSSTDFQSTTTGVLRDMQDLGSCSGHWPRAAAEGVRELSWASIPKLSWRLCDLMTYGGKPFGCHADRGYANAPYPCKNRRSLMGWLVGPSGCVCPVFTRHDYMILHRSMMIHVAVIWKSHSCLKAVIVS